MANKEIKITVPEGYEIDKESSTFECIKFKKKALSYGDIKVHIAKQNVRGLFRAVIEEDNTRGNVTSFTTLDSGCCYPEHLQQLLALNKLMNVAEYLNEKSDWDWDDDDDDQIKWYIYYDHKSGTFGLSGNATLQSSHVYFDSKEHAEQAIEILGEDTIKCALGVK